MNAADERCPFRVWRGDDWSGGYEPCAKPIKRRGQCGVHARKLDANDARIAAQDEAVTQRREAERLAEALTERFGVGFGVRGEDRIVLGVEAARALLARA